MFIEYLRQKAPKAGDLTLLKNRGADPDKFSLSDKIVMSWEAIGQRLGIEQGILDSILDDSQHKNARALSKVFDMWLSNASGLPNHEDYPLSWQGLYNLLEDSGKVEVAKEYFAFLDAKDKR